MNKCRCWLVFTISFLILALISGAFPVQAEQGLTVRSSLFLQQDGDHPLKVGSGGEMGSVFAWIVGADKRRMVKMMGVVTPQGVVPPEIRPRRGDVFVGLFPEGSPDTGGRDPGTVDDYRRLTSFSPPKTNQKIAVFFDQFLLPSDVDLDGNQKVEMRVILKPNVRGLAQSCDGTRLCGVSTEVMSIPIPDTADLLNGDEVTL